MTGSAPGRTARIAVLAGELKQIDEVRSGGYHISQSDFRVHFGLGENARADIKAPFRIRNWGEVARVQLKQTVH